MEKSSKCAGNTSAECAKRGFLMQLSKHPQPIWVEVPETCLSKHGRKEPTPLSVSNNDGTVQGEHPGCEHTRGCGARRTPGLLMDSDARRMISVKLLVLGMQNTGKTEMTYRCHRTVDQEAVDLEILDTAYKDSSLASLECSIRWADGFLLLYSITQRPSFLEIPQLKKLIDHTKQSLVAPTVLVANKADLEIGREVTTEEGEKLAKDLRCGFKELSVAEALASVETAVVQLIRMVLDNQRSPLPDRRSYMLTVRHALTRKLTRSKTMQW